MGLVGTCPRRWIRVRRSGASVETGAAGATGGAEGIPSGMAGTRSGGGERGWGGSRWSLWGGERLPQSGDLALDGFNASFSNILRFLGNAPLLPEGHLSTRDGGAHSFRNGGSEWFHTMSRDGLPNASTSSRLFSRLLRRLPSEQIRFFPGLDRCCHITNRCRMLRSGPPNKGNPPHR